tara:strand:+ start:708 stop:2645 length:1938 start_codon:yes stop_codon:yes gene_type:complete
MTARISEYYYKNYINSERNEYNNFNINNTDIDIDKVKIIIYNLLVWIQKNYPNCINEIYIIERKKFENFLNLEFRRSKIVNIRKSILLNVCNYIDNTSNYIYFSKNLIDYIDVLKFLLRKRPSRNISGITSITVITEPFPDGQRFSCRHNCYYCPNEPAHEGNNWQAQPRSYLYNEPAVLRANQNSFLAIDQMLSRMDTLYNNGHVIDKIEIILEGGTYTEYPVEYLERFNRDIFYIANVYNNYRKLINNVDGGVRPLFTNLDNVIEYFSCIRQPLSIEEETELNKTSDVHIIGISCETRPDALDDEWLWRFRKWGITRVQLGMQHVDNVILKKINRGHTIEQGLWAMQYLKDNCFKIDIHIMPDLPGSDPDKDINMFDYVYKTVCPDEMKIYPCEVVPWTVIEKWYKEGKYTPYFDKNNRLLFNVIKYAMLTCPNYVRLPRVIRDIPNSYVESGNTFSNMRQMIDNEFDISGEWSMEIRSREIGRHTSYYNKPGTINVYYTRQNNGDEYFIAYESLDFRVIFGFIRLRIVDKHKNITSMNVLKNCALIRELHVYGETNQVGSTTQYGSQHIGIGKRLLKTAEIIAMKNGYYKIVVISGEGVKKYYEKFGYSDDSTFMKKHFNVLIVWFYQILNFISLLVCYFGS